MIRRLLKLMLLIVVGASASLSAGCNLLGAVAVVAQPPRKIPAVYTPANDSMFVLVENYDSPASAYLEAEQITAGITSELAEHKVAPLIDSSQHWDLRQANPAAHRSMSISQIGQRLGAKQVLYVRLIPSTQELAGGSDLMKARLDVRVKIIDVATGHARWPVDLADGYPMSVETPFEAQRQIAPVATLRAKMCRELSNNIAVLFYERTVID